MDIPTGTVGLVGLLAFLSWMFAEYRNIHRWRGSVSVSCGGSYFRARGSLEWPALFAQAVVEGDRS